MKRILMINPDRNEACGFYRSSGILKDLRHKLSAEYDITLMFWNELAVEWEHIYNYDIVFFQRPWHPAMADMLMKAKSVGCKIWLDYDDNLLTITDENKAWQLYTKQDTIVALSKCFKLADIVTVTTNELKDYYSQYNDNVVVVPNAFNDDMLSLDSQTELYDNTVLWRGSDTHVYDVSKYSQAIYGTMIKEKDTEFIFMGYWPWTLSGQVNNIPKPSNMKFIPALGLMEYFQAGMMARPKVVHVPLNDTNFNKCKSNIAFIEATYWGAITIIPEWWGNIPGTIHYKDNDQEGYYNALLEAINLTEEEHLEMLTKAKEYIKDNLLLSKVNEIRVDVIKKLLNE